MPVRHRTHFTAPGERKKCPPDLEGQLRNPLCRKELNVSGQGKSGYGPIPPGPKPPHHGGGGDKPKPPHGGGGGDKPHGGGGGDKPKPHGGGGGDKPKPPKPPDIPAGPGSGVRPMDIIEPIVAGGLTGYGAYRARRALGKIQRNRAKGFDWRGRPVRGSGTDIEMRPLRPQNVEDEDIEERAGSTETRGRELRQARNVARSRPNRSSILDDEPEERPRPRPRRLSARSVADEQGPRGPRVPSRLQTTSLDEPAPEEIELRPLDQIRFTNVEEEPEEPEEPAEPAEPPEPAEEFRPVSLDDPENPAVQQQWQRSFRSRLQQLFRKPPDADPEAAETELTEARTAEVSAQAEATEADTTLQNVDDAVEQSRTQLERQQNELRQTRTQLTEEPEEARPTDLPDDTYDEDALDAQAEGNVAGEEAEGLEDSGDIRANLEEEEELEDPEEDIGDLADVGGEAAEDTTALTLEEAAGESELLGGGPEDPVGDIVAGTLAIAGAAVALGQWFSGLFHHNPSWNGISNATALTGSSYTNMINNINKEISNTTDQNKIKALNQYKSTLQTAQNEGRAIVSYTNSQGNKAIAVQLSKTELANAIQAYQVNPDVYKGWDKNKLKVMGLNPNMSDGASGATKTPNGTYVPTMAYDAAQGGQAKWTSGAGGGNWSNFYLSEAYQKTIEQGGYNNSVNTFGSLGDIQDSGNTPAEKKAIADGVYIQQLEGQIEMYKIGSFFTGYNDGTYNYLQYKLALFKYQNGYSNIKPTPVPPPMTQAGKEEMAKLQTRENALNTAIATMNAQLSRQQAQLTQAQANQAKTRRSLTDAQNALTTAQQKEQQAMAAAKSYDTNLANTLTNQYSQQYIHDLQTSLETNTAFNPAGLINPKTMYDMNAIQGTGITAPKANPVPSGIEFVGGVPQILSSAVSSRTTNVLSGINQPTTGSAPSSRSLPARTSVAVNPVTPAVPAKPTPATSGAVSNSRGPP